MNWRSNDLFFLEINFIAMLSYAYPSAIVIITLKFLLNFNVIIKIFAAKVCGPQHNKG